MSIDSKISAEFADDFRAMPPVLRALLEAELAAGNTITEVFHSFPAPPAGACFRLARPVTTRPRASGEGIVFRDFNSSIYSGEFTDAKRFYFLIEPPNPPPPEPDMDAIRAGSTSGGGVAVDEELVRRFEQSMRIDYEKWREGIGYDLEVLRAAGPAEKARIEALLTAKGISDWRDVEALAAIDSPNARGLLGKALRCGDPRLEVAVLQYARHLITDSTRIATLVSALAKAEPYGGITQTLLEVEEFHPPAIIDALFRGVLLRENAVAGEFAAMLLYLHGKAESPFDWDKRPFFFRFHTTEREAPFRELCSMVGVDPEKYLSAGR